MRHERHGFLVDASWLKIWVLWFRIWNRWEGESHPFGGDSLSMTTKGDQHRITLCVDSSQSLRWGGLLSPPLREECERIAQPRVVLCCPPLVVPIFCFSSSRFPMLTQCLFSLSLLVADLHPLVDCLWLPIHEELSFVVADLDFWLRLWHMYVVITIAAPPALGTAETPFGGLSR